MAVVWTDAYTVGANIALESYPSGSPDYTRIAGSDSSGELTVNAANDRVQNTNIEIAVSNWGSYRITDAVMPTGDQEMTLQGNIVDANTNFVGFFLRMPTSNAHTGYLFRISALNEMQIVKRVAGTDTVLDSDGAIAVSTTYTLTASAQGTGTVLLDFTDGTTVFPQYSDSTSPLDAGTPGVYGLHAGATGNAIWFDNASVDDMDAGGGGGALPVHQYAQMMAA